MLWDTAHHAPAYDLTIDQIHTYHVTAGDESALVHNNDNLCEILGPEGLEASQDYTGEGSRDINGALRSGSVSPDIQQRIDAFEDALSVLDEFEGDLLHRGTNLPEDLVDDLLDGRPDFIDQGFTSTSTDVDVTQDFLEGDGSTGMPPVFGAM